MGFSFGTLHEKLSGSFNFCSVCHGPYFTQILNTSYKIYVQWMLQKFGKTKQKITSFIKV